MNEPPIEPGPGPESEAAPAPGPPVSAEPGTASPRASSRPAEAVRRQNRLAALALVVLVVALAFGGGFAMGRASAPSGDAALVPFGTPGASGGPTPAAPGASPLASAGASPLPSDGPRLGRPDAPVTIDYWADYQCPFCARFAQTVIPQLSSRIADGTVALVHRDFAFIGSESVAAAVAVRCAGNQGRYWAMHDAVYAAQQGESQGAFARARLDQIADSVGLDRASFTSCLDERAPLVEVLADTAAGVRAGIQSTPTIDVNGTRYLGVPDVATLLGAIDGAAAGATPGVLPTPQPTTDPWSGIQTSGREAGSMTAPVTVELWMDYQATGSAAVANDLEAELRARTASGAIRLVLKDLALLGDESVVAATMVRCVADQGGPAWFASDVLSVSAQGAGTGIFTAPNLLRFGARLGLDVQALSTCIDDPAVAEAVRAETADGTTLGLPAGPSVVIRAGDREVARFSGVLDVGKITKAIDAAG